MKRFVSVLSAIMLCACVAAQGICLGVVVPDEPEDGISKAAFKKLGTRLERLLTNQGAVCVNSSNIVLFPVINIKNNNNCIIEGGMRNIYHVEFELTIKCVSMASNTTFGTVTYDCVGDGYDKGEAVSNGFSNINKKFGAFYADVKKKVEEYYTANKAALLAKARSLVQQQKYDEAMAILYEFPQGCEGYEEIQKELAGVFRSYQTKNCSQALQAAQSCFATQDYEGAAAILGTIDATSSCSGDVAALQEKIRAKINQDIADQKAEERADKDRAERMEKARLNAVTKVMTSYYNSRPRVTYHAVTVHHRW